MTKEEQWTERERLEALYVEGFRDGVRVLRRAWAKKRATDEVYWTGYYRGITAFSQAIIEHRVDQGEAAR